MGPPICTGNMLELQIVGKQASDCPESHLVGDVRSLKTACPLPTVAVAVGIRIPSVPKHVTAL